MEFLSEMLNLTEEFEYYGIFDPLLDIDSKYFINIILLKNTKCNEFKESYSKINKFFKVVGELVINSNDISDRTYKQAIKKMITPEIQGLGLGYSDSNKGSGIGKKTQK